ncbi:hypothetical protein MFM001_26230 [Mycobacterium sp. MFM001]|nr:hypothetical protein MFM001_26230 [Mycobacterium sp. MFM001]
MVSCARRTASAAASSQDTVLVPIKSVTRYTLMPVKLEQPASDCGEKRDFPDTDRDTPRLVGARS